MMISFEPVQQYRNQIFRLIPGAQLKSQEEAVGYVNERGFIYFWPIAGVTLPNLWTAVAGNRPVADEHDDPGHVTWGWKDALLGGSAWYYAKVLRKKATMISFEIAPYFYALSENYGSMEEDYLTLYEQGRLTQEEKTVYEALLDEGPLDTIALRRAARLSSQANEGRFNRAMQDLQADFKILPVAVTQAGAWHYAFAYDIVARHYPVLPEQARAIRERTARNKLAEMYLRSVGAAQLRDLTFLFGWNAGQTNRVIDDLVQQQFLCRGLHFEGRAGEWFALRELFSCEEV